jgi:hypothetical protein
MNRQIDKYITMIQDDVSADCILHLTFVNSLKIE